MRPADLLAQLMSNKDSVLLFDRRNDVGPQAQALGYNLVEAVRVRSPIDNTWVNVALLRPHPAGDVDHKTLISNSRSQPSTFVRLLDRFYVPVASDTAISGLFFELIADRYDELTTADINIKSAEILLKAALAYAPANEPRKVLDFGCGTGCVMDALKRLGPLGRNVEILGTDQSAPMLAIARSKGQIVMPLEDWRGLPKNSFSAAVSCFVLHYGVPTNDLARIAKQLKPGACFSANLFKSDHNQLDEIVRLLGDFDLDLSQNEQMETTRMTPNRHLIFIKRSGHR